MKKPARIYFDMDGVLADFNDGVAALCLKLNLPVPPADRWDWCADLTYVDVCKVLENDPNFWLELAPFSPVVEAFHKLNDTAGVEVMVATSPAFTASATPKLTWCKEVLGAEHNQVALVSRKELLARARSVLVDDRASVCRAFVEAGGTAVLLARPYSFGEDVYYANDDRLYVTGERQLDATLDKVVARLGGSV